MKPLTGLVKAIERLGLDASASDTQSMVGRIRGYPAEPVTSIPDFSAWSVKTYLDHVVAGMRSASLGPSESARLCRYIEARGIRLPQDRAAILAYQLQFIASCKGNNIH